MTHHIHIKCVLHFFVVPLLLFMCSLEDEFQQLVHSAVFVRPPFLSASFPSLL